jgi:hypothetical protein
MLENCIYFLFYRRLRKIFKKISMVSKLSDNLFRRTVRTMTAILKSRSTGALVGIDVLYFMNKAFIWGYLFSILMKVSLSRREKSILSKSSSYFHTGYLHIVENHQLMTDGHVLPRV